MRFKEAFFGELDKMGIAGGMHSRGPAWEGLPKEIRDKKYNEWRILRRAPKAHEEGVPVSGHVAARQTLTGVRAQPPGKFNPLPGLEARKTQIKKEWMRGLSPDPGKPSKKTQISDEQVMGIVKSLNEKIKKLRGK